MSSKKHVLMVYAGLLAVYVASYLSRGEVFTRGWGRGWFSYLPSDSKVYRNLGNDLSKNATRFWTGLNVFLIVTYYPAWVVDHYMFESPIFVSST